MIHYHKTECGYFMVS